MKKSYQSQPALGRKILCWILPYQERETLLGDFDEIYKDYIRNKGKIAAWLWYWGQILFLLPSFFKNAIYWSFQMFKNYLKTALRNINRYKGYSFINIAGLAIAMAVCIVILIFVQDELSYDKFHENSEYIYRVAGELKIPTGVQRSSRVRSWVAPNIISDFPEVIDAVRMSRWGGIVSHGDKRFDEDLHFADPNIFNIFTFPIIEGDKTNALRDSGGVLITQELANKYFGDKNPLGKTLTIDNKYDFRITGILKNIPFNSHIKFNFLAPFDHMRNIYGEKRFQSNRIPTHTYLLLGKNASPEELEKKFHDFIAKYQGERYATIQKYFLQPLTSIHLQSNLAVELEKNSNVAYSYALSVVAFVILLIACINFMNLSTACAPVRSKEVGMRKVVGANRLQLITQFLGESIIYAFFAMLCAIVLAKLLLPFFNSLMNRQLTLNFKENLILFLGLVLLVLFVGFVSGSYPALFLASFRPVEIFKGQLKRNKTSSSLMRNGLVVFQFAISLVLIIGTLVILHQMNFIWRKDLGFEKEYVITLPVDKEIRQHYEIVETELLKNPNVTGVTASGGLPGRYPGIPFSVVPEGSTNEESIPLYLFEVDYDFFDFYGIDIIEGRSFSTEIASDMESAIILNETAAKVLGWESPIGHRIKNDIEELEGTIIGVVKDFHNVSLHEEIKPSIFQVQPQLYSYVSVRIHPDDIQGSISFLEERWRQFSPNIIFYHSFLDENIAALYHEERKIGQVFIFSSLLAVFLACLGLSGLISFSVKRRTKEIGIRKVLGASILRIVQLLTIEFTKLIILANAIAWPIAYFAMNKWLQNFAYQINIGLWMFLLAGVLAFIIALLTVSLHTIKAALANPVDALRYE